MKVTAAAPSRARAPGSLRSVEEFVNTLDLELGTDELGDPESVVAWLAARGLLPATSTVDSADVARATELREALRAILVAHGGGPQDAPAIGSLERAAAEARLGPHFEGQGSYRLRPAVGGVKGALGWIVAAVLEAIDEGSWERLKACRNDGCRWAFYDASRNRSGAWCRMAVCGNRMKVRAYRRRRQEGLASVPRR
jgi:predicted RNA-binding Zn ribbon-like protein